MQVLLAKHAGFCFGVKRAITIVEDALTRYGHVYLLGPIIHNPQEVSRLENRGAITITDISQCDKSIPIVISTHGISQQYVHTITARGITIIDTTCPIVKKAQKAAEQLEKEHYKVILVGEASHPEVLGILGNLATIGYVVEKPTDLPLLQENDAIGIISQTTMSEEVFNNIITEVKTRTKNVKIINTICNATRLRQDSAVNLAKKVSLMLIIGGFNSANTRRLYELCNRTCHSTYHIETTGDIKHKWFDENKNSGITAGASTPNWIISDIISYLENLF
ncbi:4-hydroxy-3-methylbut-2-enyl diphosphate reductase [Chlamydiota bacterium]